MPFLYSCRHSGDQYRITKFNEHFELEGNSTYLCTTSECDCPAGVRPTCRHREMLPKFLNRNHVGDGWFFDYDRGGWVQGPELEHHILETSSGPIAYSGYDTSMGPEPQNITATQIDERMAETRLNGPDFTKQLDVMINLLPAPAKWRRF